ncbi:MAG TPA: hypothetical protein VMV77_12890 [Bacteroidales bacterium]|nr:hypothetical protein [Bacteroidales bacterium]
MNMKAKKIKKPRSIFNEEIINFTRKDNKSDMRYERMTRTKKLFGITFYHKDYSYDCEDYEESRLPGYKR